MANAGKARINRSLLRKWSLPYFIMAFAAVLTLIISAGHMVRSMRENLEYTGNIQLDITRIRIDSLLSSLRQFSAEAGSDVNVLAAAGENGRMEGTRWELYQLTRSINDMEGQSSNHIYLYFPGSRLMASDTYYGDSESFYQHEIAETDIPFETFQTAVSGTYQTTRVFAVPGDETHKNGYLIFVRPVNVIRKSLSGCNAVMLFDLDQLVKASDWLEENDLCIADRNNKVIIGSGDLPEDGEAEILDRLLDNARENRRNRFSIRGKVVTSISSDYENWDFCVLTQDVDYLQQIKFAIVLVLILIAVYVFLLTIVVLAEYRKRYTEISKTIGAFAGSDRKGAKAPDSLPQDAYEYIDSHIRQLVEKNLENDDLLQHQRISIRRGVYSQVLHQRDVTKQFGRDTFRDVGLTIANDQLCVLLRYKIEKEETASVRADLKDFILKNVTEENLSDAGLSCACLEEGNEEIIYAVWKKTASERGELTEAVRKAGEKTKTFVTDQFHIGFESAISDEHHGIDGIRREFGETETVFTYRKENDRDVICYRDLNRVPEDHLPQYPVDMENRLLYCIQHGDEKGAQEQIGQILALNKADLLSGEAFEYLTSRIASDIFRAGKRVSDDPMVTYRYDAMMRACHAREQDRGAVSEALSDAVRITCQKISDIAESEKQTAKGGLGQEITEWIGENYANPEMNAAMVAEHFSMTPAVLSRYFKQAEGDTPSHYITSLRLSKAKEELLKGKTVEEVSRTCGFASKRTFLRVFKQYEGVTPSQYRDLHSEENGHGTEG
jgi:two-component system response regulator YesN